MVATGKLSAARRTARRLVAPLGGRTSLQSRFRPRCRPTQPISVHVNVEVAGPELATRWMACPGPARHGGGLREAERLAPQPETSTAAP